MWFPSSDQRCKVSTLTALEMRSPTDFSFPPALSCARGCPAGRQAHWCLDWWRAFPSQASIPACLGGRGLQEPALLLCFLRLLFALDNQHCIILVLELRGLSEWGSILAGGLDLSRCVRETCLEQKGGMSTLETSERYVGRTECVRVSDGWGLRPFLGRRLPEEVCSRQKRCGEVERVGSLFCFC